jgi:hypothetical protein
LNVAITIFAGNNDFIINLTTGGHVEHEGAGENDINEENLDNIVLGIRVSINKHSVSINSCIDGNWGVSAMRVKHRWTSGAEFDIRSVI